MKVLQRTSAPVITDVTFHQDQHLRLNRALIIIRTGPIVKNLSSVYNCAPFAWYNSTNPDFRPVRMNGPSVFPVFQGNPWCCWT